MNTRIAVVFVHGFTGGASTWTNSAGVTLPAMLASDSQVAATYDFFSFTYFTKVTGIFQSLPVQKLLTKIPLMKKMLGIEGKVRSNRPIDKLSHELLTYLSMHLHDYDEVVLVAHSMGGLVAKAAILSREHGFGPTPVGYISVAVPHKGAIGATLLKGLNVNASELAPLSEYNDTLNEQWTEMKSKLPDALYLIAQYDEFVAETSATPYKVAQKLRPILQHDHTSIAKPASTKDGTYIQITSFLLDLAYKKKMSTLAAAAHTANTPQYEKEIFVLKMLVCEIGKKGMDDAKSCFFNAEIMSKSANKIDLNELNLLKQKVLSLYQQKYNQCNSSKMSPNEIFAAVHAEIKDQDAFTLKSTTDYINFLHKKGLLHQMANNLRDDVIWSDDTDLAAIEAKLS